MGLVSERFLVGASAIVAAAGTIMLSYVVCDIRNMTTVVNIAPLVALLLSCFANHLHKWKGDVCVGSVHLNSYLMCARAVYVWLMGLRELVEGSQENHFLQHTFAHYNKTSMKLWKPRYLVLYIVCYECGLPSFEGLFSNITLQI